MVIRVAVGLIWCVAASAALAQPRALEPGLVHLRSGAAREWSSFPPEADGRAWQHTFADESGDGPRTLCLRQQDVKQGWRVVLNDTVLGTLTRDENDMRLCLPVPWGIVARANLLRVEPVSASAASDDIRIGAVVLHDRSHADLLSEASVDVTVTDEATGKRLPARITIADADGALAATGTAAAPHLAVRAGVVYTATGTASITLPAGRYTVYAGRGFEYSLARAAITLEAGARLTQHLTLRREVPMPGYVASDTHIHTLTHSGHGDATLAERVVTLAGEGIELPITTEHNRHVDIDGAARAAGVRRHFTPVVGNEVTTPTAHVNILPVDAAAAVPDATRSSWQTTFDGVYATAGTRVAILNHPRDVHAGTRPFGARQHLAPVGAHVDGWPMRFNAIEVLNSGATQSDPLLVVRDWMALLNHGYRVAPVGSSDSHDVTRYIVGQGRTYVRAADADPGAIDVEAAARSLAAGQVLVSYGLVAELTVDARHHAGDVVPGGPGALRVAVRVLGPHWVTARRVQLYANGVLIREGAIDSGPRGLAPGVRWEQHWDVPRPAHDVHLVAVARGDGVQGPWWPTGKPYQPATTEWEPYTLGVSGAVWVDGDADGRISSAYDYAWRVSGRAAGRLPALVTALESFDEAVAIQAAHLAREAGTAPDAAAMDEALRTAAPAVQRGFEAYRHAWRAHLEARRTGTP